MRNRSNSVAWLVLCSSGMIFSLAGCASHQARPSITAVGLSAANRCEPQGIPYYLPKPLLVVAKNVRHIDESKIGLTGPASIPGGFDNQAAYADVKANVTVPASGGASAAAGQQAASIGADELSTATTPTSADLSKAYVKETITPEAANDFKGGLSIDSFFTYQIIFVPDLTQKYGLRISGGAGEVRAAMNLVNGWMYTGMGPYYFKDSSSAQNAMASGVAAMYAGRGASDVINSVGNLASKMTGSSRPKNEGALSETEIANIAAEMELLNNLANTTPKVPKNILNYAEIYIYEPVLAGDQTEWRLVADHHFDRDYFDSSDDVLTIKNKGKVLDHLLKSISARGGGAERDVIARADEIEEMSVTTPGGSTLRIHRPNSTTAVPEGSTTDEEPSNGTPGPVDRGVEFLRGDNPIQGANGVGEDYRYYAPNNQDRRSANLPQVAINVLPNAATPKPVVGPSNSLFPKLHRFVHRESAKVVDQRGDISTETQITNQ